MDNKFYVSYEAAMLLKEKGYDEDVRNFYDEEGLFLEVEGFYNFEYLTNEELDNNHYAAPTKAEAIDWLESKSVCIVVIRRTIDNEVGWRYVIYNQTEIISGFSTRLEAEEAAIIKALEIL
jgi:hypothetical protein